MLPCLLEARHKSSCHLSAGLLTDLCLVNSPSNNDNDSDPAPTPLVWGTRGRRRDHSPGRGATTGSTRSTRATKNMATKVKEESKSEDGEDLTLVETLSKHRQSKTIKALAQDEEETESMPTSRKCTWAANVEKKNTVCDDNDLETSVKCKGPGRPRKVVKSMLIPGSPEVVPSNDEEEPVAPKAKLGVKTSN
ncbi:hypothetical protein LXA43DRAFT_1064836 [Ganoderma leucocontextum]|nr:hypothetical protein LXA43DRAFT_1064836 [Ganoderma leucocontextum]